MAEKQTDDLTRIKGIGPSRQKWFGEAFGVTTYEELARLSPDVVETRLKAEGRIVSRNTVEEWINEAAKLATGKRAASGQQGETSKPRFKNDGWRPFASFVVEFQERQTESEKEQRTLVHYIETGEEQIISGERKEDTDQKTWPGLEDRQVCKWMIERLGKKVEEGTPAREGMEEATPEAERSPRLNVREMYIYQPPETELPIDIGKTEMPISRPIEGGKPFALEATLGLEGAAPSPSPIEYGLNFFAKNLSTGEKRQLGAPCKGLLLQEETSCKVDLPEPSLSPGIYRITAVATLPDRSGNAGYLESLRLHVT